MKRQFSFLWVAFACLVALSDCSPTIQSNQTPRSALVKIECYKASEQQILHLLRSGRARDIKVVTNGSSMEITAAFSPADTPPEMLAQVIQNLNDVSGVVHVELVENPRPIMQNF